MKLHHLSQHLWLTRYWNDKQDRENISARIILDQPEFSENIFRDGNIRALLYTHLLRIIPVYSLFYCVLQRMSSRIFK